MATDGTRQSERSARSPSARFRAIVESYDDAPDQCTIYPADVEDHERMSTWITANEPAFVDLEDFR